MTYQLPKRPDATTEPTQLAARLFRFATEVVDFLKGLPMIEVKTVRTDGGNYPLPVLTDSRKPFGVLRLRTYVVDDPSRTISDASVAWQPSDVPEQPGILITELGGIPGPAPGEEIETVLLILGERD